MALKCSIGPDYNFSAILSVAAPLTRMVPESKVKKNAIGQDE